MLIFILRRSKVIVKLLNEYLERKKMMLSFPDDKLLIVIGFLKT